MLELLAGFSRGSRWLTGSASRPKFPISLSPCKHVTLSRVTVGLRRLLTTLSFSWKRLLLWKSNSHSSPCAGLLATAEPGRPTRQAPRLLDNVLREGALFYHRVYSWWILLQCWGTLRFSDHRGLRPIMLAARLTRSKTIGTDNRVAVSAQCFVSERTWVSEPPQEKDRPQERLPFSSPVREVQRLRAPRASLRRGVSSANEDLPDSPRRRRISLQTQGSKVLDTAFAAKLPPQRCGRAERPEGRQRHAGRLGSERYARVSKYRIMSVQRQVARTFF